MGKFLTGAFSLGLMLLLVGYGQPGPKSAGLPVSAGWFAVLWPAVALMIALPVHALAKAGQRFSAPDPERVADLAASPILMRPSPGRTTPSGRTGPPPGPNRPTTGPCRPRPFCPAPAACAVPRCSTYRFLIPNVVSS
jgi:hypothetical protein